MSIIEPSDGMSLYHFRGHNVENVNLPHTKTTAAISADIRSKTRLVELPEAYRILLQNLEHRFQSQANIHEGISWAEVKEAITNDHETLAALKYMEDTGGEPDVVFAEGDEFVFGDTAEESPEGRRNKKYFEVEAWLEDFYERNINLVAGEEPNILSDEFIRLISVDETEEELEDLVGHQLRLMSEKEYRYLQRFKNIDQNTSSWLKTPRKKGYLSTVGGRHGKHIVINLINGNYNIQERGFRCSLRVKKARQPDQSSMWN